MSAKLDTREVGDVTVVDVSGRITLGEGSSAIRGIVRELVAAGRRKVLLNLSDVTYIDSSGIGELVSGFTTVANAGGTLKLLGLSKRVRDLLQITRLHSEFPDRTGQAVPDSARLAQIRETLRKTSAPVRPLHSNGRMMLICVGVFAALALALTTPVGFHGFAKLSASSAAIEYSVVILLALVLAGGAVEQMIPGSRRIMSPAVSVLMAILLLSMTASLLFPDFETRDFVRRGIPCLRLGVLCAIPAAGFIAVMMRRGFVIDPPAAAIAGGALAGLLGVGVLALHCPILTASHIIAWHVAVIAVTSLIGAASGWILSRGV